MSGYIDVHLITGFLGSGKTTFLNRLIEQFPKDRKLMILMNEFGEIGIDGTLIAGSDLDILEISKGSIFCACVKTDFIKGLYEVAQKIKPDLLIMESTGVANPQDIKKDLTLPIFNDRFRFKEQFCLVDAANFLDAYQVFAAVERQISSSTRFIINKIDLVSPEQLDEVKDLIKKHHPGPVFYDTSYAVIDITGFMPLPKSAEETIAQVQNQLTDAELDQYTEELLGDPEAAITPPDILMSATFLWQGKNLSDLEGAIKKLPREVLRAKGFITAGGKTYLMSYVMGQYSVGEYTGPIQAQQRDILVLIYPPQINSELEQIMTENSFVKKGDLMPGQLV